MKTTLIILAVIAVLAVAGIAWARYKGYCTGDMVQNITAHLTNRLDLDEPQRARLDALADTFRRARDDWQAGRQQTGAQIVDLLGAPTLDRDRALGLIDERRQIFDDHKQDLVQAIGDFTDSLNADQRQRLVEMVTWLANRRWGPGGWRH